MNYSYNVILLALLFLSSLVQTRGDYSSIVGRKSVAEAILLRVSPDRDIEPGRHRKLLKIRGGDGSDDNKNRSERELVLGKDRELVHFAVDLKWVWAKLTDKLTYVNFMRSSWRGIRNLAGVGDEGKEFKDIAIDILYYIRSVNLESTIKLFLGNIKMAEWLAMNTDRLILVYVEDGVARSPSTSCIQYRRALSDPLLGDFINEKFVFFAGATQHKATKLLATTLFTGKESPVLAVLAPRRGPKDQAPQVLAALRLAARDIEPDKISEFLIRTIEAHGSKWSIAERNGDPSDTDTSDCLDSAYEGDSDRSKASDDSRDVAGVPLDSSLVRRDRALEVAAADLLKEVGEGAGSGRSLVAVTVSMRSGLQFQHHFEASETLETVATWGRRSHAIASDDSEEFFIVQPLVRFTPSNLKRTLLELRLPRSVVLSVVKKTKRSAAAFAAAALEASGGENTDKASRLDPRPYMPPGAPV